MEETQYKCKIHDSCFCNCDLINGDCLEEMKKLDDDSIDLIFCDLPYGQTSCKWDCKIDLELFWKEVMRIKKLHTPIFFTTTTKFGVELIQSAPKKCHFRYDLCWVKSTSAGFLCVYNESSISVKDKGDIKIKDVKINDYVKSKNGFIKVLDYFDNGKKECYKIITNNNLELILTKDHKIETKTGLKPLEEIKIYNQELILTDNGFDYIKKIEYVGMKDTCDIEVEHIDHTYYCNNISISNCAKKMPLRKHEMIYVFYEKLPFYDLSSHQHKFVKSGDKGQINGDIYCKADRVDGMKGQYNPPLPNSVVKEEKTQISKSKDKDLYGDMKGGTIGAIHGVNYDPPLPNSVIKGENNTYNTEGRKTPITREPPNKYDPPLPNSVVKDKDLCIRKENSTYGNSMITTKKKEDHQQKYDPPLPVSVVKEESGNNKEEAIDVENSAYGNLKIKQPITSGPRWDPPLPDSMLEIKSTRGKHSTEKPVALMEWILKYYSKEGDVVLDPTCGSGSTGVACKNMKRNFIGIEMDEEIFKMAQSRII
eukprot:COSAG04_NODE_539_length_12879_cov_5.371205_4_plen_537_part_00